MTEDRIKAELAQVSALWRSNNLTIKQLSEQVSNLASLNLSASEAQIKYKELLDENAVLSNLIKQYELALDTVMKKFRIQTSAIHQDKQELRRKIEHQMQLQEEENDRLLEENLQLSAQLQELTNVVRDLMQVQGNEESQIAQLMVENMTLRSLLNKDTQLSD